MSEEWNDNLEIEIAELLLEEGVIKADLEEMAKRKDKNSYVFANKILQGIESEAEAKEGKDRSPENLHPSPDENFINSDAFSLQRALKTLIDITKRRQKRAYIAARRTQTNHSPTPRDHIRSKMKERVEKKRQYEIANTKGAHKLLNLFNPSAGSYDNKKKKHQKNKRHSRKRERSRKRRHSRKRKRSRKRRHSN